MIPEIGFTNELTNTQYAPLALLLAHYQQNHQLDPLRATPVDMRTRDYSPGDKLLQVMISILAGCETLFEVKSRLKSERPLAAVLGWEHFADQSSLSRTLDALSLKQIDLLREHTTQFWRSTSQTYRRNWHRYLWLDYDLSGLPCSAKAQASQKGFFSDKKMPPGANWRGSARSGNTKRSGRTSFLATRTQCMPCNPRSWPPNLL